MPTGNSESRSTIYTNYNPNGLDKQTNYFTYNDTIVDIPRNILISDFANNDVNNYINSNSFNNPEYLTIEKLHRYHNDNFDNILTEPNEKRNMKLNNDLKFYFRYKLNPIFENFNRSFDIENNLLENIIPQDYDLFYKTYVPILEAKNNSGFYKNIQLNSYPLYANIDFENKSLIFNQKDIEKTNNLKFINNLPLYLTFIRYEGDFGGLNIDTKLISDIQSSENLFFNNSYNSTIQYKYNNISNNNISRHASNEYIFAPDYHINFTPKVKNSYIQINAKINCELPIINNHNFSAKVVKFTNGISSDLIEYKDIGGRQLTTKLRIPIYIDYLDTDICNNNTYTYQLYYKSNRTDSSYGFIGNSFILVREIKYDNMSISNKNIYNFSNNNNDNKKLLSNNILVKEKIINNFLSNSLYYQTGNYQDTSYNITFTPESIYNNLLLDYNILYNSSSTTNQTISFRITRHIINTESNKDISEIIVSDTSLNTVQSNINFKNIYSIFYIDELSKLSLTDDDYLEYKLSFYIPNTYSIGGLHPGLLENSSNLISIKELKPSSNKIVNKLTGIYIDDNLIKNYIFKKNLSSYYYINSNLHYNHIVNYDISYKLQNPSNSILLKYKINFICNNTVDEKLTFIIKRFDNHNGAKKVLSSTYHGSTIAGAYRNIYNIELIDQPNHEYEFTYQLYLIPSATHTSGKPYGIIDNSTNSIFLQEFTDVSKNYEYSIKSKDLIVYGETTLNTLTAGDVSFSNLDVSNILTVSNKLIVSGYTELNSLAVLDDTSYMDISNISYSVLNIEQLKDFLKYELSHVIISNIGNLINNWRYNDTYRTAGKPGYVQSWDSLGDRFFAYRSDAYHQFSMDTQEIRLGKNLLFNPNNFTGTHQCFPENDNDIINDISYSGLIVSSTGNFLNTDNSITCSINESLPIFKLTTKKNDKAVFGVISEKEKLQERYKDYDSYGKRIYRLGSTVFPMHKENLNEYRFIINSLGEGGIWVCNKDFSFIENGDYITSSDIPGYGTKQHDDILHNYTVAKVTCDCSFSLEKITKQKVKVNILETISLEDITEGEYGEEIITIVNIPTKQEIVYGTNGEIQYEDDLDNDGNKQLVYKYDTKFITISGNIITESEYHTRKSQGDVYISCFLGCTYHCG